MNIATRKDALRLLNEGTTIVVFPAGGVATSPTIFGPAVDLPWKTFTARMILASRAQVVPLFFEGQCSPLFHLISRYSQTIRLSLMIREFRRRVGQPLHVHAGDTIDFDELNAMGGRKAMIDALFDRVHRLAGGLAERSRMRMEQLPDWLKA